MWRTANPKINRYGQIYYGGMWPHQRKWWQSTAYIKALVTGYGGGKTFIGAKRSISLALHNNGSPHLVVSPSYKIAKRTIIPTIKDLLDGRQIRYSYNRTDFEFIISDGQNKGVIWIGSGDQPDSLKGPNIGSALIDEPFVQDRAVFDQILARVRDPNARKREILLTGTPEDLNWGYEITEGDEAGNFDLELIQASTADNKALPKQYLKTLLAGYDDRARQAYVDGQFVSLNAGAIYHAYDTSLNASTMEIDEGKTIIVGMDFNVDPMAAVLCQESNNTIHACDEIILPNSNTAALCNEIVNKYPKSRFIIYPDSSGKSRSSKGISDFAIITQTMGDVIQSIEYPRRNPALRDRFNAVNAMLCNAKNERRLFINRDKCPELARDLRQIAHPYEEYKRKNKKRTHASDALGYIVSRRYPIVKPAKITIM